MAHSCIRLARHLKMTMEGEGWEEGWDLLGRLGDGGGARMRGGRPPLQFPSGSLVVGAGGTFLTPAICHAWKDEGQPNVSRPGDCRIGWSPANAVQWHH